MYLSTVDSDHSIAAGDGQLGHFFQHLLHLWNNELPGQNCLEDTDAKTDTCKHIAQAPLKESITKL